MCFLKKTEIMFNFVSNNRNPMRVKPLKIYRNYLSEDVIYISNTGNARHVPKTLLYEDIYKCSVFKIYLEEKTVEKGIQSIRLIYDGIYKRESCFTTAVEIFGQEITININCSNIENASLAHFYKTTENRKSFVIKDLWQQIVASFQSSNGQQIAYVALWGTGVERLKLNGQSYQERTFVGVSQFNDFIFEAEDIDEEKRYEMNWVILDDNAKVSNIAKFIVTAEMKPVVQLSPIVINKPNRSTFHLGEFHHDFFNATDNSNFATTLYSIKLFGNGLGRLKKSDGSNYVDGTEKLVGLSSNVGQLSEVFFYSEDIDIPKQYTFQMKGKVFGNPNKQPTTESTLTINIAGASQGGGNNNSFRFGNLHLLMDYDNQNTSGAIDYYNGGGQQITQGQLLYSSNDSIGLEIYSVDDHTLNGNGTIEVYAVANNHNSPNQTHGYMYGIHVSTHLFYLHGALINTSLTINHD